MSKLKVIGLSVAGLVAAFMLLGLVLPEPETTADKTTDSKQEEAGLAKQVDTKLKEAFGIEGTYAEFATSEDYPDGSLIGFISGMEDVNDGTVRVLVQTDLTEEEAKQLGTTIMGNVGLDLESLDWIVVRGVDGLDRNVSRNDIPALR